MRVMSILVIVIGRLLLAEDPLRAEVPAEPNQEKGLVVAFNPFSDARVIQTLYRSDPPVAELLDTGFSVVTVESSDIVAEMRKAWLRTAHEAAFGCAVVQGDFTGHLDQASRALDFLNGKEAAAHLRNAYLALQCSHEPVSPRELARYLVFRGLRESLDGLSPESSFLQALSIDEDYPFPSRYARAMRDAFARARNRLSTTERVTVTLEADPAGLITLIDGDRPLGSSLSLLPGPHLIFQHPRPVVPTQDGGHPCRP